MVYIIKILPGRHVSKTWVLNKFKWCRENDIETEIKLNGESYAF